MAAFIVRRLMWFPFLLLFVSLVTFALGLYGPGDPIQIMMGLHVNPATVERIRHELGLDQPFLVQYLNYLANVLQGNLGYSLVKFQGQPVGRLIAERLPVTLQLNLVSILWGLPVGVALGILAALKRNTAVDWLARVIVIGGISIPVIVLNPFLTFAFSRQHELFLPFTALSISIGPFLPVGGWDGMFSPKIILPAFIEGLGIVAVFTRQTRAGLIEALAQDYVRTARAKGLRERLVVVRHALRNALIPLATIVGFLLGGLVEGSFLVENWFGVPGLGQLAFEALFSRDYYVMMAITLLVAMGYAAANLLIDVSYVFLNPTIRYQRAS